VLCPACRLILWVVTFSGSTLQKLTRRSGMNLEEIAIFLKDVVPIPQPLLLPFLSSGLRADWPV
jgi:hypothetical protein